MKTKRIFLKLYVFLGFGLLFSVMTAMILSSEQGNLETFYDMGGIGDVSKTELLKPNDKWSYDSEADTFVITGNKALKTFQITSEEKNWGWMYVTIEHMSVPQMDAKLVYFNEKGERRYIEDITLHEGENILDLEENCPCTKLGISLQNADGQTILITRMQVRELLSLNGGEEKVKRIFLYSFGGYAGICILLFIIFSLFSRRRKHFFAWDKFEEGINWISKGLSFYRKKEHAGTTDTYLLLQRIAWSVLFLFLFWRGIFPKEGTAESFLMDTLIITGLIVFSGFFQPEGTMVSVKKVDSMRLVWRWFIFAVIISDLMVSKEYGNMGILFFIPFVLVARRYRTKRKYRNLCRLAASSLEITFAAVVVITIGYWILAGEEQPFMWLSSNETIAMSAVLVFFAFLTELLHVYRFRHLVGAILAVAVCAVTAPAPAWIGVSVIMLLFAILKFVSGCRRGRCPAVKTLLWVLALFLVFLTVIAVFKRFSGSQPEIERLTIWKNYIWRWNLFGNQESKIKLFAESMEAYNAYLAIAFRYGIFILIPYVLMQALLLIRGFAVCLKNIKLRFMGDLRTVGWDSGFFSLGIVIAFISFCFAGNVEKPFGTPLWICYYLIAALSTEKTGILEIESVNVEEKAERGEG